MKYTEPLPDAIVDSAINWLIRLEMSDAQSETQAQFNQWLQQAPEHELAWLRVKGIKQDFSALPAEPITQTLNTYSKQSRVSRRQMLKILSISSLMFGSGWLAKAHTPWQRLLADYSTETGQQSSYTLGDGSTLTLNTDSAVSVDLAGNTRKITLRRGEIQLKTAADRKRPFLIKTPTGRISSTDCQCTVLLEKHRTRVSVVQGEIDLLNRKGDHQRLLTGDSFWLADQNITPAQSVISPHAWTTGAISGKNIPLGELLDQLSRYRVGIIDYAPELKHHLVSGTFQLNNSDTTLNFLAQVQPVTVEYRTPYWVIVHPA